MCDWNDNTWTFPQGENTMTIFLFVMGDFDFDADHIIEDVCPCFDKEL